MIKFCKTCRNNNYIGNLGVGGYYWSYLDSATRCDKCGADFENIDFPALDLKALTLVSQDVNFIEAMIKLRQDNVIEYESRMVQFRVQAQQLEQMEILQERSTPKCPVCGSFNLKRITTTSKIMNTAMFGLLGTKRHKTFHCNNCGYEF